MSSTATKLNRLAQSKVPSVAVAKFPDTMDIKGEVITAGSGGGRIKTVAVDYEGVPCFYESQQVENRVTSGDKITSIQQYLLWFPTHHGGERMTIDPKKHSFTVLERGNEPEKVFKIVTSPDVMGVLFKATCVKEN